MKKILILTLGALLSLHTLEAQSPTPIQLSSTPAPTPVPMFIKASNLIPAATVTGVLNGTIPINQAIALPAGVPASAMTENHIIYHPDGSATVTVVYKNPAWVKPTPAPAASPSPSP